MPLTLLTFPFYVLSTADEEEDELAEEDEEDADTSSPLSTFRYFQARELSLPRSHSIPEVDE